MKVPHLGHISGDVIIDATTVDVAGGVPVDIPVGVLTGLGVGAITVGTYFYCQLKYLARVALCRGGLAAAILASRTDALAGCN